MFSLRTVISFSCIFGLLLYLASNAYFQATEREVIHKYLSDIHSSLEASGRNITWEDPVSQLARPFTQADKFLIGKSLSRAWQRLAIAQETGVSAILADGFSGVALDRGRISVADAKRHGGRIAILGQKLRPIFYHKDGSLFQAISQTTVVRFIETDLENIEPRVTIDTGIVTLMNEATGWRVYSYEMRHSNLLSAKTHDPNLPLLNGVNYYPSATPWHDFWRSFDQLVIRADFERIQSLGANSVRIFLQRDAFLNPLKLEKSIGDLETILAIAASLDLMVVPTLFDLKGGFSPGTWGTDFVYLQNVLGVLANSEAVIMIDIKNEPDLDFQYNNRSTVLAWLIAMITATKSLAEDVPVTIGWSSAEQAVNLFEYVDVVSYHAYEPLRNEPYALAKLEANVGSKSVMITEIGESSYSLAFGFPASLDRQAARLERRLKSLETADGIFVWALFDFPNVDRAAVGNSPWVHRLQSSFGLLMANGREKPSAQVARSSFRNRSRTLQISEN